MLCLVLLERQIVHCFFSSSKLMSTPIEVVVVPPHCGSSSKSPLVVVWSVINR